MGHSGVSVHQVRMQQQVTLGVRGYSLANKDLFSKSDPYLVVSRPVTRVGWTALRTTETVKNDLNPVWRNIVLYESELPQNGEKLRFEVFDDDGKLGNDTSDESIGVGSFTLAELEEAFATRLPLTITDKRWGRKSGSIIITELRRTQSSLPSSAFPPSLSSPYPSQAPKAAEVNVFSEGTSSAGGFVIPSRI